MRRILLLPTLTFLAAACGDQGAFAPAQTGEEPGPALSGAPGEEKSFEISVEFFGYQGRTIADERGLTFFLWGETWTQPSWLYPEKYWGDYPLYLPGSSVAALVRITNLGPRANARLRVVMEAYTMNLDGSNSQMIKPPDTRDEDLNGDPLDLALGETATLEEYGFNVPVAAKGLNRYVVKLFHRNEGGGPGNEEPGWIMTEVAIFCPPDPEG